nr:putative ribonuclease H-like domain-containing protein [Tanacetum cinerariifolium]
RRRAVSTGSGGVSNASRMISTAEESVCIVGASMPVSTVGMVDKDFEDVYFVKELKFNLLSVSKMCDKKNSVLFTNTECVVLSLDFKLLDESQVLLKVPRNNNMYSFDLQNVVPVG